MKQLIHFIFLLFSVVCLAQEDSYTIQGTVKNAASDYLYIKGERFIDSAKIKNEKFEFIGKVDYPLEVRIMTKNGTSDDNFYIENSNMTLTILVDENEKSFISSITGNETAIILQDLQDFYSKNEDKPDLPSTLFSKLDTIISNNPKSQFSGSLLSDVILDPIFSFEQAASLYAKLDLSTQRKNDIQSLKNSLLRLKNLNIGDIVKDFELPNAQGELLHTSNFKKRFLLIEFWASWCKPCREYNPELVKIYNDHNKQGFEIYGVSLDHIKESWLKAIKKDNLNWVNTIAEESWNTAIVKSLGIEALPSNFLVDKNGQILAMNIKPAALEEFLNNH